LRLIPLLATRGLGIGLDDMFQYDMLARSLASGYGFRWYAPADLALLAPLLHIDISTLALDPRGMLTTFRAPLYPGFLAIIYRLSGINDGRFFAARLAQTLLGAALAPLTYFTAGALAPSNAAAARLSAWSVATYPMLLIFPLALATENLFFPLVLAAVLVLLQSVEKPQPFRFLLAGLLLGLAALTRSIILPFAALAILWVWLALRQRLGALLVLLALLLTVAPWIVRNSLLEGKPTGIETSLGYNLYVGYYPDSTGTFLFGHASLDLLTILDDRTRDQVGTQKAIQFIEADPARFPYLMLRRLGYFFDLELRAFSYFYVNDLLGYIPGPLLGTILLVLALPFVVVSLSGTFGALLLSGRPQIWLLLVLLLGYLMPHIFILSEERFHLTLVPFIAILAAQLWTRGPAALRTRGTVALVVAGLVAALLIVNWSFDLLRDGSTLAQMLGPNGNQLYLPY
jgi:hypothetical protein